MQNQVLRYRFSHLSQVKDFRLALLTRYPTVFSRSNNVMTQKEVTKAIG